MKRYFLLVLTCLLTTVHNSKAQSAWTKVQEEFLFQDAPFGQCHASTLVETSEGKLLVAWFGGSAEGKSDVDIWLSVLDANGTTKPVPVANGIINDSLRYPTWNPVLFKAQAGPLFLFYKVGPNPREWWGMVKRSEDDGQTWSEAKRLPAGILGPIKNKPVQLADGTILSPSSVEERTDRWKVHIEKSGDGGKTWQHIPVDPESEFDVIQPSILFHSNKRLQILCRSKQGRVVQAWSSDGGNTWGKLSETRLLNPNAGTDAVTLKDGKQLIVYNPDVPGKDWFNGRGKLHVATSKNGRRWKDIVVLENGKEEEYSYPAVIQTSDSLVHITYTYDRKNIKHVVLRQEAL
ncbi:putative neuraminidase [Pontibacter ummariensis]|uniref:Predicted neuraminidase (Sialidase) n=1 Tax=Pontibacter ummariensis TaxID=1610492 RepID=A0A239G122_9BACT|nr:sialidase family protein [Pontibacter ummariensis]PRY11688.1 putative neuraminidase [Pontibacter ummariensis]SNS62859.1 Predicted neuraminidase (sialidase) [Pontibacter ummariensis]